MNIVVGVTGGIAAYKAVGVVRLLVLAGHRVQVIATEAALRFVGKPTFEAISRNPVHTDLYEGVAEVRHVALGQGADLILVAPATANSIAKLAAGLADDLLGNTILASTAPLLLAPAMHTEMWRNAATVANVALLRQRGVHFVGPGVGQLTGKDSGEGRMSEPEEIVAAAVALGNDEAARSNGDLAGLRVLVTAGGTREPLDPVRYIGNRSSGKQGVALATAATERGATVHLIAANVEVDLAPLLGLPRLTVTRVSSTAELATAVHTAVVESDAVIMAAAVADYRPETVAEAKIKKDSQGDRLELTLVKNPDILADIAAARAERHAGTEPQPDLTIIGFAAETETDRDRLLTLGRAKVVRKGSDYLVLNTVGWSAGFATDVNTVILLSNAGDIVGEASGGKREVADRILDLLRLKHAPQP
ncbi:bifunctional phosphopantothenoylcysteine decarboxylase/phosphopantothenate--cysteine ligase CoaBC [Glaciihabitans tibetensis]|uniref:bifunctional phosphopantothenoylcysteine decarboxylase/phosphopantothenate--cysteine ligase CoaBC n=1 Tax=Glaciihabitans tibetensis TaxID=1266600 RepID=UPI000D080904|nr:bifunctional phosphopantothenoylcysteine decarboxylase/phosphopantothenate--cysteine ligase CoaBC [Glaciihabitans tibetensis]